MTHIKQQQSSRKRDDNFFAMTEKPKAEHAFQFWLKDRKFNHFEEKGTDKNGNVLIGLQYKYDDNNFDKVGIICCLSKSEGKTIAIIEKHLLRERQEHEPHQSDSRG